MCYAQSVGGKCGKNVKQCQSCKGRGFTVTMRQMGPMVQQVQQPCGVCHGQGETIGEKCTECKGHKVKNDRKIIEVHISKGMKDGQRITFAGEGDQALLMEPGDITIVLSQQPHPHFVRRGDDLIYEAKIDLLMALAGGQFAIPHLDDRVLIVSILPGETIRPGMVKTIPRQGMPIYRHHDFGNLYIKFTVDFPSPNWTDPETIKKLESTLPPRPTLPSFGAKYLEEVVMQDANDKQTVRASSNQPMDVDDEDKDQDSQGPGVQCAQQ